MKPYASCRLRESPKCICDMSGADCLETLEEIAVENHCNLFMAAGGKEYSYIPALNDDKAHIKFIPS